MINKKRGVALLWSLIISAILLVITGTIVSYMVKESRMTINIEDSTQAYANSRGGVDWANEYLENNKSHTGTSNFRVDYNVVTGTPKSPKPIDSFAEIIITDNSTIKSTGVYGDVRRSLEYDVQDVVGETVKISEPVSSVSVGSNRESFDFQFDFWLNAAGQNFSFGLQDDRGLNKIYAELPSNNLIDSTKNSFNLVKDFDDGSPQRIKSAAISRNVYSSANNNLPGAYRVKISYVKETMVSMKLLYRTVASGKLTSYSCVGYTSIPLEGNNFGDLNKLFIATSVGGGFRYVPSGPFGDGEYISVGPSGSPKILIDNTTIIKSAPIELTVPTGGISSSDAAITIGGTVTINWNSSGAESAEFLNNVIPPCAGLDKAVPLDGSCEFTPTTLPITYTIKFTNEVGSITSSVKIRNSADPIESVNNLQSSVNLANGSINHSWQNPSEDFSLIYWDRVECSSATGTVVCPALIEPTRTNILNSSASSFTDSTISFPAYTAQMDINYYSKRFYQYGFWVVYDSETISPVVLSEKLYPNKIEIPYITKDFYYTTNAYVTLRNYTEYYTYYEKWWYDSNGKLILANKTNLPDGQSLISLSFNSAHPGTYLYFMSSNSQANTRDKRIIYCSSNTSSSCTITK